MQDILDNFEFRHQIPRLSKADALGTLIEKLTSPDINLSPAPVRHADGSVKHPGLDNHGMGTIFEELVRRFNEENNEEAGEHWTPRDAVRLMAKLVFLPVAGQIKSGTYLIYDGACGTGGIGWGRCRRIGRCGDSRAGWTSMNSSCRKTLTQSTHSSTWTSGQLRLAD